MPDLRTDAQLVAAYLGGDRGALAGIYDRYGAGLYDTAAAMLRDRHEAADCAQDVFLVAAERLGQLREAERLKPWLYAILRNEVYRRTKRRGRTLPTDFSAMGAPEMAAPMAPDAEGEMIAAGELAELVRSAACGLDERDQLVLELSVRQGLQGADLAAALGVTPEQSYTLVHRMRDRVERSLGAVVVAKAGRKDCADLADILKGWDGEFTVLLRKRVARHIEACATCERTRKKAAPLVLLGAAPAFAAPPSLRDTIMGKVGSAPTTPYQFDADGGFPRVLRRLRLPAVLSVAASALLLGVGGGAIAATALNDDPPAVAAPADSVATSVAEPGSTVPSTPLPSTSSTDAASTTTSTNPSTTVAPTPGALALSVTVVDLGADLASAPVEVRNTGGQALAWSAGGDLAPFTLVGNGGTVEPGAAQVLTITLNRTPLAEGTIQRTVTVVDGAGGSAQVVVKARVERPPLLEVDGPEGDFPSCQWSPFPGVYVNWSDESGVTELLTVEWTGPQQGSSELEVTEPGFSEGQILVRKPSLGVYDYVVTAVDTRGNVATWDGQFEITPCPG